MNASRRASRFRSTTGSTSATCTTTSTFHVDTLTVLMLVVVTGVSMLVHLYSLGYMAGDPSYSRFFTELALFTVSMLILVLGANFLVIFIGWELVGLSSYLLIGFWFYQHRRPPAPRCPTRRPRSSKRSSRRAWATSASSSAS